MFQQVLDWIKANPWKAAVIVLSVAVLAFGGFGYGCGYVKGCNAAKVESK